MDEATKNIEHYYTTLQEWQQLLAQQIRKLIKTVVPTISEELRWGQPTFIGRRLLFALWGFKKHLGLVFFTGALIEDSFKLFKITNNRQNRTIYFYKEDQLTREKRRQIKEYIIQLVALDARDVLPPVMKHPETSMGKEMESFLDKHREERAYFNSLAPGHRREYIEWVESAKKEETRQRRLLKMLELLIKHKTLKDHYSSRQ